MRTLLALVALVAPTVAALSTQEADACGSYRPMPVAYAVQHHGRAEQHRQFVVFGELNTSDPMATEKHAWTLVGGRGTYDNAEFAFGRTLDQAIGVTLLAPGRAPTYVTSTSLGIMRDLDKLHTAIEIKRPKASYVLALHGKREDARLTALAANAEQTKWTISGTEYSLQYESVEGQPVQLVLRYRGEVQQTIGGQALGVLTANEGTFLAVQGTWGVQLVEI